MNIYELSPFNQVLIYKKSDEHSQVISLGKEMIK
jgi:hypothetical protein